MESNDVSVVDNNAGKEVARISVGKKPNGISYWAKP
jgi:YVTN family beta-propeller protein